MGEDDFNFVQEVEDSPPPPNDENIVVQKEKTEKKEEPKKEIKEQEFTKKSTGINIDIHSAQDFILELQFATQMFNQASEQLKKIEEINTEIHLLRIKQGREISGILTRDQMKILHDERKQFFEKMRHNPGGLR